MRVEPVANVLAPVGFLGVAWLGLFLGAPEVPLILRALAVGAGMWAVGWCAGKAGRLVLRDAVERIRAKEQKAREDSEKRAAEAAGGAPQAAATRPGAPGAAPAGPAQRG